ncbi:hypothetical protein HRI_004441800 [Hibiscus trionum]|uniref:SNRNP25 ubiquitin-like domain-containing protein n=1 Tax=Hibiscus trionum TaxID=183268 RepID=A0A9W7J4C7_HIBTR|nr:hypothetical protein HRI_004441800 [Hibiscus trionum]
MAIVYTKLRQQPIHLSVRKLDGSLFDVYIMKTATIAELKLAVEYVFSQMPDEGSDEISWPLVWGHFCLSYKGQKLVSDTDQVVIYGIKDGDQLRFVRHVSSIYCLTKIRSKKSGARKQSYLSKSNSNPKFTLEDEESDEEVNIYDNDTENQRYHDIEKTHSLDSNNNQSPITRHERRFRPLWRGWHSYSRLPRIKTRTQPIDDRAYHSGYGCGLLGKVRNMLHMLDSAKYEHSWRED